MIQNQNQIEYVTHQKAAEYEIVISFAPGMLYPYLVYTLNLQTFEVTEEECCSTPGEAINLVKDQSRKLLLKGLIN